ncbi:hypothetical protein like AT1G18070 [Hibiscus trionum]|uniref:Tr-type G domain-containing protein n=1 Tax=Hibiscus trionum TaxID=183268 RepID=A0A9W7MAD9_HIBTR|nr:hypothetical protein like AT1G18070 [Hibiscus trionum]
MDIEAEIRALQLDSAEDDKGIAIPDDAKPEEVEMTDKAEEVEMTDKVEKEGMKDEVDTKSQPVHAEPKVKDKEVASLEDAAVPDEMESQNKRHLNVVFIGHVDAGKSTTGGQILFLSGQVDDRTIQKYEKEAKDKSRESW